ncbi:MAG: SPOR domain-containing protein [Thiohalomonas sp.]|nr:SPOR domain-containing protein [Thiohalomonas sp.]
MSQLDRLGLRENPFSNNIDQRYFYADQNRAQILDSTEHLIEYSSNFQVIIGESGMGKSLFLEALANRIDNNWRVAKITDAQQYDTLTLIQTILDVFGAINDEHVDLLEALETQLTEINQLGFKPVLFVDSAEALSIDSLRFLIQLSQQKQNEEPYINIVLFATTQVSDFLQSPELKDFKDIVHIASLSKLDKEGVSGYLRHKMAVAGFDRETPFTPRIIDSIYSYSDGIPQKIDYFADKFLASSGKADNYIEPDKHFNLDVSPESVSKNPVNELNTEQPNNLLDALDEDDFSEHRSDRVEAQLNRLTEKFEEIEQMGEQSSDTLFAEEDSDDNEEIFADDNSASESGLSKFVIPMAMIGILVVAIITINSVFEQSDNGSTQVKKEKIDLLPLELPPEKLLVDAKTKEAKLVEQPNPVLIEKTAEKTVEKVTAQAKLETTEQAEELNNEHSDAVGQLDLIENTQDKVKKEGSTEDNKEEIIVNGPVDTLVIEQKAAKTAGTVEISIPVPELKSVEPEPVIGSNSRQYITIIGNNLEPENRLIVSWADSKKEFSQRQTPKQWRYINKNKIKLHLSTGITPQQWSVSAKNKNDVQSSSIHFDVVKPFISKLSIKGITPNPFIGSDKRQAVSIKGEGFSKQTVVELRWDKNKKHFSSPLTPSQFEYINSNQIKLFIATGIKKRKWTVVAISPAGNTSTSFFSVVNKAQENIKKVKSSSDNNIKDEHWLKQQVDTNYTIQLFGSYNKNVIDDLVKKYALKGDILKYTTQRNGQNWYTMTYGNYKTRQEALSAVTTLHPALTKTAWVRNFSTINDQLSTSSSANRGVKQVTPAAQTANITFSNPVLSNKVLLKSKNEAWVWTQNPADFTIQLIALSSEAGIKDYMKKYAIESQSVYFKTMRDGKALYVLIYGNFTNKTAAQDASKQLTVIIKGSNPWVRSFSAVHGMMSGQ